MTKNNQRFAYILYFIVTSIAAACLALGWYMSPLGLGFAAWPEANRNLLEYLYKASYFVGIPAILSRKSSRWFFSFMANEKPLLGCQPAPSVYF